MEMKTVVVTLLDKVSKVSSRDGHFFGKQLDDNVS